MDLRTQMDIDDILAGNSLQDFCYVVKYLLEKVAELENRIEDINPTIN